MIDFKLDPSSGYADSYTDIQFIVKIPSGGKSEIRFFNDTVSLDLEVLGVDAGHILNETTVVTQKSGATHGYINLFNKDKMNVRLTDYVSVDIRCQVTQGSAVEEQTVTFYNQSKSLDGSIIPFDLIVNNHQVDITSNIPLKMHIVSGTGKKYELCIRSDDGKSKCTFEVSARKGHTTVSLPSEVICSDLELTKNHFKKFKIYWVKFEGVTYQKTMNRKFLLIDNTELLFNAKTAMPKAQTRHGPVGDLSEDFVLSNRYFVHTQRTFSGFGRVVEGFGPRRMDYLTRFMYESQNMQNVQKQVAESRKEGDLASEVGRSIQEDSMNRAIRSFPAPKQTEFLTAFSSAYARQTTPVDAAKKSPQVKQKSKEGGCGCTRKKQ